MRRVVLRALASVVTTTAFIVGCGPRVPVAAPVDVVVAPGSAPRTPPPAPSALAVEPRARVPKAMSPATGWRPCDDERILSSIVADVSLVMHVRNTTDEQLSLVWLDYTGQRVHYMDLAPGDDYDQQTYVTHPWLVLAGSRCVGLFMATEGGEHEVVLRRGALRF